MIMKEKVENILGDFLERNKDYAVTGNISNGLNGNPIFDFLIPIDRQYRSAEKVFYLKSNMGDMKSVNRISIPYDEVLACYEEVDKDDNLKISETVVIILKNSMEIDFECCGMTI